MITQDSERSLYIFVGCGTQQETSNLSTEQSTTAEQTTEETTETLAEEPHTHSYTESITTNATCSENGEKTFTCDCGDTYIEEIQATGHQYGDYVSNQDATYEADGTETATCSICRETDTRTAEGSKLTYTFTDLSGKKYAKSTVNVRALPNTDGEKLGGLTAGQEVEITGQCNETKWYRIKYNDTVAYVSDSYLIEKKPTQETQTTQKPASTGNWYDEYAANTWYDMGSYFFIICDSDEASMEMFRNCNMDATSVGYHDTLLARYNDGNHSAFYGQHDADVALKPIFFTAIFNEATQSIPAKKYVWQYWIK